LLRIISAYFVLSVVTLSVNAQSWEIGLMGGGSNYHGDLAYNIVPKETKLSGGAFFRYNFNEFWAIRPTVSYFHITGSDANFDEYYYRNLSFRNRIYEVSSVFEFNFQPFSNSSIHETTTFYGLLGIGAFKHEPEAYLDGQWYKLKSHNTENNSYKLLQLNIPIGVGIKHALNDNFILGVEAGWRKTFTDYLDDVSTTYTNLDDLAESHGDLAAKLADRSWEVSETGLPLSSAGEMRGDPNLKDWYFQTAVSISYRFTPIKCPF
jgi:hypothetical protein